MSNLESSSLAGSAEPTAPKPYRLWREWMPFRKNGTPVVGNMGSSAASVIIMRADDFKRMIADHPSLATAAFEVAKYDDE